jgi:hypothetical protein
LRGSALTPRSGDESGVVVCGRARDVLLGEPEESGLDDCAAGASLGNARSDDTAGVCTSGRPSPEIDPPGRDCGTRVGSRDDDGAIED